MNLKLFGMWLMLAFGGACEVKPSPLVLPCGLGEYLAPDGEGRRLCLPCPENTFMDQKNHHNYECAACSLADEFEHQVLHESCTQVKDSVILCEEGYFMQTKGPDIAQPNCQLCQICGDPYNYKTKDLPIMVSTCGHYHDTGCSKFCGRGLYIDRQQGVCETCGEGSYMDIYRHEYEECKKCTTPEEFNHEIEFQKCTKTRDSIILCQQGYYRVDGQWPHKGRCVRCRECGKGDQVGNPYEVTPCGVYTDVKCGKKPIQPEHLNAQRQFS